MSQMESNYLSMAAVTPSKTLQRIFTSFHLIFTFALVPQEIDPGDAIILLAWSGNNGREYFIDMSFEGPILFSSATADPLFTNFHFQSHRIRDRLLANRPIMFSLTIRDGLWSLGMVSPEHAERPHPSLFVQEIISGELDPDDQIHALHLVKGYVVSGRKEFETNQTLAGVKNVMLLEHKPVFRLPYARHDYILSSLENVTKWYASTNDVFLCARRNAFLLGQKYATFRP